MKKIIFTLLALLLASCNKASNYKEISLDRTDTIMGIDKNANGVRDDIESYIKANFTEPKKQKALMQYAKSFQEALLIDPSDKNKARAAAHKEDRGAACVWRTLGTTYDDPNNGYVINRKIRAYTTNTKARLKAYLDYDKALSGMVFSLPQGDTCDE
ncbi:MAG: hypothetical protein ACTTIC_04515 [Helicobacteraceae bacterium]